MPLFLVFFDFYKFMMIFCLLITNAFACIVNFFDCDNGDQFRGYIRHSRFKDEDDKDIVKNYIFQIEIFNENAVFLGKSVVTNHIISCKNSNHCCEQYEAYYRRNVLKNNNVLICICYYKGERHVMDAVFTVNGTMHYFDASNFCNFLSADCKFLSDESNELIYSMFICSHFSVATRFAYLTLFLGL